MKHTHYFYGDFIDSDYEKSFLEHIVNNLNDKDYQTVSDNDDVLRKECISRVLFLRNYFIEQMKLRGSNTENTLNEIMELEIMIKKPLLEVIQKSDYLRFSCFQGITEVGKAMVEFLSHGDLGVILYNREISSEKIEYNFIITYRTYQDLIGTGDLYGNRPEKVNLSDFGGYDITIK